MSNMDPINAEKAPPDPLPGCTRLAAQVLGTFVAPVAAGLALGVAVVIGGEVLFGAFHLPRGADTSLAILFVLALIALLLAGILFVLSVRR
jgi:hypothetical protein